MEVKPAKGSVSANRLAWASRHLVMSADPGPEFMVVVCMREEACTMHEKDNEAAHIFMAPA